MLLLFNRQRGVFTICFLQSNALGFATSLTGISTWFPLNHHLRTKQNISLLLLVRYQPSISIEPSFYEQSNTFLQFLPSIISV